MTSKGALMEAVFIFSVGLGYRLSLPLKARKDSRDPTFSFHELHFDSAANSASKTRPQDKETEV